MEILLTSALTGEELRRQSRGWSTSKRHGPALRKGVLPTAGRGRWGLHGGHNHQVEGDPNREAKGNPSPRVKLRTFSFSRAA